MAKHARGVRNKKTKCLLSIAAAVGLAATLLVSAATASLKGQSAASEAPAAQPPPTQAGASQASKSSVPVPQWQIDAGGKMEFDVASVKQNTAEQTPKTVSSNIPLGPQDVFTPTGGRFSSTNFGLVTYMVFAYKINPDQIQAVLSQLPKWANSNHYDIEARAPGNPTKDQYRLMMQALLADRFKLALHYETRQVPVLAMVLDKPGKLGPQLQLRPDSSPCSNEPKASGPAPQFSTTVAGGFPEVCGGVVPLQPSAPGQLRIGGRAIPVTMLTPLIDTPITGVGRPVVDKTGLSGKVDFVIEFTPEFNGPLPPGANFQPDPAGPTFMEALKDQLGLKLESRTGPVESIVVDHVEQPSEN